MKKTILTLYIVTNLFCNNAFSKKSIHIDPIKKPENEIIKNNYQYFSKLLIYPLNVDKIINIKNGGNTFFKVSIYDEKMILIVSLNTSPFCSNSIAMDSFKSGKYIINVDSESETHQFSFSKK